MFIGRMSVLFISVASRAATIRLSHDTICIAIQSSRYDTYRDTFENFRENKHNALAMVHQHVGVLRGRGD